MQFVIAVPSRFIDSIVEYQGSCHSSMWIYIQYITVPGGISQYRVDLHSVLKCQVNLYTVYYGTRVDLHSILQHSILQHHVLTF